LPYHGVQRCGAYVAEMFAYLWRLLVNVTGATVVQAGIRASYDE
jgi:hypothetical protein